MKSCCGDTDVFQDEDGQLRCTTCRNLVYDYLEDEEPENYGEFVDFEITCPKCRTTQTRTDHDEEGKPFAVCTNGHRIGMNYLTRNGYYEVN